jgi:hypothetical protein
MRVGWFPIGIVAAVLLLIVLWVFSYSGRFPAIARYSTEWERALDNNQGRRLYEGEIQHRSVSGDPGDDWRIFIWWALLPVYAFVVWGNSRRNARITRAEQQGRVQREECLGCGYSLYGNVSGICPECGRVARIIPLSRKASLKQGRTSSSGTGTAPPNHQNG